MPNDREQAREKFQKQRADICMEKRVSFSGLYNVRELRTRNKLLLSVASLERIRDAYYAHSLTAYMYWAYNIFE